MTTPFPRDIPGLHHAPEDTIGRQRRDWIIPETAVHRRGFLKGVIAGGAGIGLAALGVFPPAKRALAEGYTILHQCPANNAGDQCEPGCSPSDVCSGGSNGPCCINNDWHKSWHQSNGNYNLRPNQCIIGQDWDGWDWSQQNCGICASLIYKCHDGKKKLPGGSWKNTICRVITYCAPA